MNSTPFDRHTVAAGKNWKLLIENELRANATATPWRPLRVSSRFQNGTALSENGLAEDRRPGRTLSQAKA
jgi:hypothetical protein